MKKFKEIATGAIITVINVDESNDLAIMDNGNRINFSTLIDKSSYREFDGINESYTNNNNTVMSNNNNNISELDDTSRYNSLLNNIKNINTSVIHDVPGGDITQVSVKSSVYDSDSVANRLGVNNQHNTPILNPIPHDSMDIEQNLIRKAQAAEANRVAALNKQNELLSQFMDDDISNIAATSQPNIHQNTSIPEYDNHGNIINQPNNNHSTHVVNHNNNYNAPINNDNSYTSLLKNIKKTKAHKLVLKYDVMIPDKAVLKMFDESFDISIIDILTDEYFNNIINDRELFREQIKTALNEYVSKK